MDATTSREHREQARSGREVSAGQATLDPSAADQGQALAVLAGPATVEAVIQQVARIHGLQPQEVTGRGRTRPVVAARQQAMWLARWRLGLSYAQIGRALDRDHTTVIYGVAQVQARQDDPTTRWQLLAAEEALSPPARAPGSEAFPAGWEATCQQILERARDPCPRCECRGECGMPHRQDRCQLRHHQEVLAPARTTPFRIHLAVVALDGNPDNDDPANLRALCPPCRLRHQPGITGATFLELRGGG